MYVYIYIYEYIYIYQYNYMNIINYEQDKRMTINEKYIKIQCLYISIFVGTFDFIFFNIFIVGKFSRYDFLKP